MEWADALSDRQLDLIKEANQLMFILGVFYVAYSIGGIHNEWSGIHEDIEEKGCVGVPDRWKIQPEKQNGTINFSNFSQQENQYQDFRNSTAPGHQNYQIPR
jgi:hypothetical protein